MKFIFGGVITCKRLHFSVKDVKYELDNYCLLDDDTYTTSNVFIRDIPAKVSFENGYVLIISSKD